MDRIAREGVVFTRGLAAAPWTTPSVAAILTGLPTTRHGAGLPLSAGLTFSRSGLDARFTTLAERFSAAGYRTRAVVANGFLGPESGMAQGFEEYSVPVNGAMMAAFMRDLPLTRLIVGLTPPEKWGDYRAQGLTDTALRWLDEPDPRPLFLWVHYIDPHTPYKADPASLDAEALAEMVHQTYPPLREDGTVIGDHFAATDLVRSGILWLGPRDRDRIRQYYAGAVAYTDKHVGRLFEALRARGAKRPVVAALTADHGEEFWDHGHFEHGHDYYREVTWVPLVFWGAGASAVPAGRTVNEVVGLVDIAPTLVELAGLPAVVPQAPDEGRSLAGVLASDGAAPSAFPPRFSGGNLYGLPAVCRARTVAVRAARQRRPRALRRDARSAGASQPGLRAARPGRAIPPGAGAPARRPHAHRRGRRRQDDGGAAPGPEGARVRAVAGARPAPSLPTCAGSGSRPAAS
jgi:arylsulfatase A-like enzyme